MASTSNPSPATCQATFEQGVAISLHLWEALALAVQNNWGGPDSADKRDWFAGAVVELFPDVSKLTPAQLQQKTTTAKQNQAAPSQQQSQSAQNGSVEEADQADVESVLLQVMVDEFEVNVDDDSAFELAEQVVRLRGDCLKGKFDEVEALRRRWEGKKGNKVVFKKAEDQDNETDWDTDSGDDDEEEEEGGDVEMSDAPAPPPRRERQEPEVDEDGFTKVTKKKR
ncbi:Pre-rRNA-processing protein TSR2-domain-containing protein [Chaetomium fimeti]|uniref:Pre-rRNA-processing protein TSR2-domain-containing protein n=1 Tax=Chaetomium fimeti TaxID=1854472 RepID=A0AAE0HA92_9PEZI|nr:Pre-rRNA-processing protein TSR2-domain-containing protein [Chaetomium fimeti]